ncbi:endophilin-B1 isoform X4 [Solenopsis invicta]|uniref:endophilin-B1 isoform X4 n=1 Tax=Solenopsis invicta TaxID=13686 RepID=UPI00193E292C|nr:endophilin-B1 isoform X4 [Solenopsis invicta]
MDFNVKKLVKDAGAALSRVVQMTEETLGTSEKTELDAHLEHLAERGNATKTWTEKILRNMEAVLTPNPGNRIEDFFFEKIDKRRPNRLSNLEYVGTDMIEAGNDFGPGIAYGSALIKVGQCQQRLGQIERDFIGTAANCYIQPLRKFLDGEMKTVTKEMAILENKRLDLDACKNRVRKARSMLGQQSVSTVKCRFHLKMSSIRLRCVLSSTLLRFIGVRHITRSVARSGREGAKGSAIRVRSASGDREAAAGGCLELAGWTLAMPARIRGGTSTSLCTVPCRHAGSTARACRVIGIYEILDDDDYYMGIRGNQRGKVPKVYLETLIIRR